MSNSIQIFLIASISLAILVVIPAIPFVEALDSTKLYQIYDQLSWIDSLSESQIKECETMYEDFQTYSEKEFGKRYFYHTFVGNCAMLIRDPIWDYSGPDRYEQLSERMDILVEERRQIRTQGLMERPMFTHTSIIESQMQGSYLFDFEFCTQDKQINLNDVAIESDLEIIPLILPTMVLDINPNTCRQFHVTIRADDPDSIRPLLLEKVEISGVSSDGSIIVDVKTTKPIEGFPIWIELTFRNISGLLQKEIHYDLTATQDDRIVLLESDLHQRSGIGFHKTDILTSDSPVDFDVKIDGIGFEEPYGGPIGSEVKFTVVPEFGFIAPMILTIGLLSLIVIKSKSLVF
jgi:hypothetical protein